MNFNKFQKFLWEQNPNGEAGFEGLIAKLLEQLTGQRFYLSLSGRQEGTLIQTVSSKTATFVVNTADVFNDD